MPKSTGMRNQVSANGGIVIWGGELPGAGKASQSRYAIIYSEKTAADITAGGIAANVSQIATKTKTLLIMIPSLPRGCE